MSEGLVYIGKIISIESIPNADFIVSATVVCGQGGRWRGIVKKDEFNVNAQCVVFLSDSILPEKPEFEFMRARNFRVRMCRFKGSPSEVLIMNEYMAFPLANVGEDVTKELGVTKYYKPVPANLQGIAKGPFPSFIPKTDEPNYQRSPELIEALVGKHYYITEKADGSSTTAFRYKDTFGLCSRNYELERDEENGYWKVAMKYHLEERLPEGIAVQWETCWPKIQDNPIGLKEIDGFIFSGYYIHKHRYLEFHELLFLCDLLKMPMCQVLGHGSRFYSENLDTLGEGVYANGKQREGVVVRSQENFLNDKPISFKVINLNYER